MATRGARYYKAARARGAAVAGGAALPRVDMTHGGEAAAGTRKRRCCECASDDGGGVGDDGVWRRSVRRQKATRPVRGGKTRSRRPRVGLLRHARCVYVTDERLKGGRAKVCCVGLGVWLKGTARARALRWRRPLVPDRGRRPLLNGTRPRGRPAISFACAVCDCCGNHRAIRNATTPLYGETLGDG